MKIISLGDIHGSNRWKFLLFGTFTPTKEVIKIVMQTIDLVIFVGDYVDSYDEDLPITDNLKEIIEFKKGYEDKVILLWGNHDVFYYTLNFGRDNVTGYREEMIHDLNQIFRQNYRYFQMAYQQKNYLWTHAGVQRSWWEKYVRPKVKGKKESRFFKYLNGNENVADILNLMWEFQDDDIFMSGKRSTFSSESKVGGPLWASRGEIIEKPLFGLHQNIGHSFVEKIEIYKSFGYEEDDTSVTFVDCLRSWDELYTIEL